MLPALLHFSGVWIFLHYYVPAPTKGDVVFSSFLILVEVPVASKVDWVCWRNTIESASHGRPIRSFLSASVTDLFPISYCAWLYEKCVHVSKHFNWWYLCSCRYPISPKRDATDWFRRPRLPGNFVSADRNAANLSYVAAISCHLSALPPDHAYS